MPTPNYSFVLSAQLVDSTTVSVGNVVIPSSTSPGRWVVATAANRGTRGSEAIALTAYGGSGTGSIQLQQAGTIDAAISGLGAGSRQLVRCSAAGTIERVASYSSSDDIIGYAEADGRVHLMFGLPVAEIIALAGGGGGGGASPGGVVNSIQANNGSGGLTGYSTALVGNGFIALGASPSSLTTGLNVSYGYFNGVNANNSTNTDQVNLISLRDGSSLSLGAELIQVGAGGYNTFIWPGTNRQLTIAADTYSFRRGNGVNPILTIANDSTGIGVQFGSGALDLGDGQGVIGIDDASLVPSTNPTGGVILYSESGELKYRQPDGTIITLDGGGGGGTPGGSDTQFQWNNATAFDGASGLVYHAATNRPDMPNGWRVTAGGQTATFAITPTAARTITFQDATDTVVGRATTDTLTNKTLTSPVLGGTPVYTAARGFIRSFVGEVQTSSTTQTTAVAYTMTNETLCAFDVIVTCARRTNVTKGGRYKRSVVYRRTGGGAPTIVGALEAGTDQETTAGDDVTIDLSGNDVRVRVTAADTDQRNWLCELRAQETLAT